MARNPQRPPFPAGSKPGPPYAKGDPRAKEFGRQGGAAFAKRGGPKYEGILDDLAPLTIGDWMTRLKLTEPSWDNWRLVGQILDGIPLSTEQMIVYAILTGGRTTIPVKELLRSLWAIIGRGAGKTTFFDVCAVQAAVQRYNLKTPAHILFLAFVRDQASIGYELVKEWFEKDPDLAQLVKSSRRDKLVLYHNVVLQTIQSSWRTVRGYSVACAVADESAFWWTDDGDRNPDKEVFRALIPALGKVAGSRLFCPTTPFGRQGQAFAMHEKHFGQDESDVLVIKAPTLVMNSGYDRTVISAMELDDPENAASEFDVMWRADKEGFVRLEVLQAATAEGCAERPPSWELAVA